MIGSEADDIQIAIESRLKEVSEAFVAQYGEDLSDLRLSAVDGRFVISGTVIVPKQLLTLRRAFHDWPPKTHRCAGCRGEFEPPLFEVAVLSQLADNESLPEAALADHPNGGPVSVFSRRRGGELISEWLADDGPARLLRGSEDTRPGDGEVVEADARSLLQLADGTVGWCAVDDESVRRSSQNEIPVVRALSVGAQLDVSAGQIESLMQAVDRVVDAGVAYRLGGRDWTNGVDCSALVQRLVESCTGALLPRHSGDQMKVGQRVPRAELQPADLLFARAAERKILHVGIVLRGRQIGHACRLDGRVKCEPIEEFLERYRFLRAQRLFTRNETVADKETAK